MAKLVQVYKNEQMQLMKRQLPLIVYDDVKMVMDLNELGCLYCTTVVRPKEVDKFLEIYKTLSPSELRQAFEVNTKDFFSLLKDTVPCVGCRRSIENLHEQLRKSGHPTLEPLVIKSDGTLSILEKQLDWPLRICCLLHEHSSKLNKILESQVRSKKNQRCIIHSLEYQRITKPSWSEVWDIMEPECREEMLLIEASTLMVTLESYLQKHRFCGDCRTKVLKAYLLLVEEPDPSREKGYVHALYNGIKRCLPNKHLHLPSDTEYVYSIISRALPDVMSSGERHAKTLEVAQGEIITCLGIVVHDRLHRIQMRLKEEETTCQVLAAVAIDALSRNFQNAVDAKRGITKLELLYFEIKKEEIAKQQRKEQKKLKKKKRKERKACETKAKLKIPDEICPDSPCMDSTEENIPPPECTNASSNESIVKTRTNVKDKNCSCEYGHDCGYSSGNNNACSSPSSPEGSVACDEFCSEQGLCNRVINTSQTPDPVVPPHRTFTLSLEQMLEDNGSSDEESYIPLEDVRAFQARDNIPQKREELRQILRMRFAQLCANNQIY